MPTTAYADLDDVVVRAREAAKAAGELPRVPSAPSAVDLPKHVKLGAWLSEMIRSGEWADMMTEITAGDPEVADRASVT